MAQGASGTADDTRLLESELSLAKKTNIYFIFNLKSKEILLKARGVVLKEMKIGDVESWGTFVDAGPRSLVRKSALFKEPKRVNIDPNKNKEEETSETTTTETPAPANPAAFDIEALELKDMPGNYDLEFSESIFISVRQKGTGFLGKLYSVGSYAGWYVSRPLLTIWNTIKDRPYTSIYLIMDEEDARSVYWSLVENSDNIIYQQ